MDNEKSPVEKANVFPNLPRMVVIKGKQIDRGSLPTHTLYKDFKKFAALEDNATYFLRLPLDNSSKRIIKRTIDLVASTLVITGILSWLIPLIALLIKLDSRGAVFFLQKRHKKNGEVFTSIQFRSMIETDDTDQPPSADDERMTKLGKFLREYHIDELPQFVNVWIGNMSLIGPRPQLMSDNNKYEELIKFYDFRHKVKPGMVSLSQAMSYQSTTKHLHTIRERAILDLFYVRHWSFNLDLRIFRYMLRKFLHI